MQAGNTDTNLQEQLSHFSGDTMWIAPSIVLVSTIILLLLFDLLFKRNKQIGLYAIAGVGFLTCGIVSSFYFPQLAEGRSLFGGLLILDGWSVLMQLLLVVGGLFMLIIASRSTSTFRAFTKESELLIVTLGLILGAGLMTMAVNLVVIYIAIELVSITSYMLTAMVDGKGRSEASMKYILFGAVSSAIMLYGMSWLYGFTGTLDITSPVFYEGLRAAASLPLNIALIMTLAGFVFKLGAFPFHLWAPDVYQAAPTPIVAVFSTLPKIAILTVLFRFVQALPEAVVDWQLWLSIVAIGSMIVGNFSALWQKDAKRMLAYSSIAHAGFLLVGLIAYSSAGTTATLWYAVIYLLMNFGAFLLISVFEKRTGTADIHAWKGLGPQMPMLSVLMILVMISLTGLPPTAGFNAKLFIFSSSWEAYKLSGLELHFWVFVIGLVNTVVALFYYLRIPYFLFFKSQSADLEAEKEKKFDLVWCTFLVIPLLLLFFQPNWLLDFLNTINFVL